MSTTFMRRRKSGAVGPQPVRWTCAEFHQLGDLGAFEGRRAMLIDGVILEEGQMIPPHAQTLGLSDAAVRQAFDQGWRVRQQSPLVLGRETDPEPDLAVVRGGPREYSSHPTTAELVIEVADTSQAFDTDEKRKLYAAAGIQEYWVVDVNARQLIVYRSPQGSDYPAPNILDSKGAVSPLAAPSASIRVADLLP